MSRFILLIHGDESTWDSFTDEEKHAQYAEYGALSDEMRANGHYVQADELGSAAAATVVRVRDGQTLRTDGPFAETKEQLGGYFLVDCDLDTALAYAARIPAAKGGSIEVRPVVDG
jgi:hypothetical protein